MAASVEALACSLGIQFLGRIYSPKRLTNLVTMLPLLRVLLSLLDLLDGH